MGRIVTAFATIFVLLGAGSVPAHAQEFDTDRPGFDYSNFDLERPDYRLCERTCNDDRRCRAWTYVKPGIQWSPSAPAKCWLKNTVPQAIAANCCISGKKEAQSELPSSAPDLEDLGDLRDLGTLD